MTDPYDEHQEYLSTEEGQIYNTLLITDPYDEHQEKLLKDGS